MIELFDSRPESYTLDADLNAEKRLVDFHALQQYSFRPVADHLVVDLSRDTEQTAIAEMFSFFHLLYEKPGVYRNAVAADPRGGQVNVAELVVGLLSSLEKVDP